MRDLSNMDVFAVDGSGAIITATVGTDKATTTSSKSRKVFDLQVVPGSDKMIPWGEDNLWLENLIKLAEKSTIIPSALENAAEYIYGGGVVAGKITVNDAGEEVFKPELHSDEGKIIRRFFRDSNIDSYIYSAAMNYVWNRNIRPMISLNNDAPGERIIAAVRNVNSVKLRWTHPDKDGKLRKALVHGDWENITSENPAKPVPVIEEEFATYEKIKKSEDDVFIFKPQIPHILGNEYYGQPNWLSAKLSNWLELSLQIPKFKKFLMDNQMSVKYIVYIDQSYWTKIWSDWSSKPAEEKLTLRQETLTKFVNSLKGTEKGGNSVLADMQIAPDGKQVKLWEIVPIKEFSKEGDAYIEDSQEASSHIMWAIGADPSVIGAGPGKGLNSGGGGDKRVGANILVSRIKHIQDLILKVLELYRDTHPDLSDDWVFRCRNNIQLTLDKGKSQQETS
jgi:hypothetical protein